GELPGLDGVRHEHGLDMRVLAAQPLHDPEEERLREPAVAVRHARRDVHREEDDGFRRGPLPQHDLPIAQVVVRDRRRILGLDGAALDRFLDRAAPVEPRSHAAAVPAFARVVVLAQAARLDLEIRQLQLFPEPVDDVVDLELEDELIAALVVAARTLARTALRRPREHVARLAVTLADALRLVLAAQPEAPVLEKAYGDLDRRIGTREDVA